MKQWPEYYDNHANAFRLTEEQSLTIRQCVEQTLLMILWDSGFPYFIRERVYETIAAIIEARDL